VTDRPFAPLDITSLWASINDELIELVDLIAEERMNWSPEPKRWNFRGLFLHILAGRHGMMAAIVQDGLDTPDTLREVQTQRGIKEQLGLSWERMVPFLSDTTALARTYDAMILDQTGPLTGHALAFGQLEHDIHHRGEMYGYLDLLGVAHEEPDTPARVLRARRG